MNMTEQLVAVCRRDNFGRNDVDPDPIHGAGLDRYVQAFSDCRVRLKGLGR